MSKRPKGNGPHMIIEIPTGYDCGFYSKAGYCRLRHRQCNYSGPVDECFILRRYLEKNSGENKTDRRMKAVSYALNWEKKPIVSRTTVTNGKDLYSVYKVYHDCFSVVTSYGYKYIELDDRLYVVLKQPCGLEMIVPSSHVYNEKGKKNNEPLDHGNGNVLDEIVPNVVGNYGPGDVFVIDGKRYPVEKRIGEELILQGHTTIVLSGYSISLKYVDCGRNIYECKKK